MAPVSYEIQGKTVTLPAVVRDASSGSVMYLGDIEAARRIIPDSFEPVEAAPGRTQVPTLLVLEKDSIVSVVNVDIVDGEFEADGTLNDMNSQFWAIRVAK